MSIFHWNVISFTVRKEKHYDFVYPHFLYQWPSCIRSIFLLSAATFNFKLLKNFTDKTHVIIDVEGKRESTSSRANVCFQYSFNKENLKLINSYLKLKNGGKKHNKYNIIKLVLFKRKKSIFHAKFIDFFSQNFIWDRFLLMVIISEKFNTS